jgi:hypothetical protein
VSLSVGALAGVGPRVDGRSYGARLTHAIVCAARGGCDDGDDELAGAYGPGDARLVRRFAPHLVYEPGTLTMPVDYRECRAHRCSDAPDDPDLDAHRTRQGARATAFTRVTRSGGETFLQYWLYYPDSTTTQLNAAGAWRAVAGAVGRVGVELPDYPGFHLDDWESYQVRIDARGRARVRASAHHWYQGCKQWRCRNQWTAWTGWTRVSWGSHAGHIPLRSERLPSGRGGGRRYRYHPQYPGVDLRERTTTAPALRLVPIERLDHRAYRPLDPDISPPWRKRTYDDPLGDSPTRRRG